MRARELIEKLSKHQDGTRSLHESIAIPEVAATLKDWIAKSEAPGVVIGGCAASFHAVPRYTMDLDVLYLTTADIPDEVQDFKRHRDGAFLHKATHVEVEVTHPAAINLDPALANAVYQTAEVINGIRIASASAVVALKLQRLKKHDVGDIVAMFNTGKVDLGPFPLSQKNLDDYQFIINKYA